MKILAYSLNGNLRLRQSGKNKGVVEIIHGDVWRWCVYPGLSIENAMELFVSQARWHLN